MWRVPASRLVSMRDAIARFVPDGAWVCMNTAIEALIPFAAGHELIRQRRRDLTLIGPISDMLFDQLVGAGCVSRIIGAWVGNVSAGLGHNYRRAVEQGVPGPVEVQDHSNLTLAFGLEAAALGVPYLPTRSLLGTDLLESNPTFRQARDPWSGTPLVLVPAIVPDVAIVHVQRADEDGRAHVWGTLGVTREASRAARRVILVAEEIWPRERILSDPGLVLTPEIKVAAVVHQPFGAYPSPVQGYYARHHDFFHRFHEESRTVEGNRQWLERWVFGVDDWKGFLDRVGTATLERILITHHLPSEPLDYGAR
jgi:glutaconate CoA-transferase, subunit A